MKKLLILLMATMFLVACGTSDDEYHENINESIALDSEQAIEIVEGALIEERDLTEKEIDILDYYIDVYSANETEIDEDLSVEDIRVITLTKDIADHPDYYFKSASNEEFFHHKADQIRTVLKTGDF